jgi:hypothetical protein
MYALSELMVEEEKENSDTTSPFRYTELSASLVKSRLDIETLLTGPIYKWFHYPKSTQEANELKSWKWTPRLTIFSKRHACHQKQTLFDLALFFPIRTNPEDSILPPQSTPQQC